MARQLAKFKGVWQKPIGPASEILALSGSDPGSQGRESCATEPELVFGQEDLQPLPQDLLDHRYRLLLLHERRRKLGEALLRDSAREPYQVAFHLMKTLGHSYRPWAHSRLFALSCLLGLDLSPNILRGLRHPWRIFRYRRTLKGLWKLIEIAMLKEQHRAMPNTAFMLSWVCPPLALWILERRLQALLVQAQDQVAQKSSKSMVRSS